MREMVYQANRKLEVLDTGICLGFFYWILNLGTHPTAYVKIPKNHKYYKKKYEDIDIDVHGGLTYSEDKLNIGNNQIIEGWFIGWDYAHYTDFAGYYTEKDEYLYTLKRWTTKEIKAEVKQVCKQLKQVEVIK